MIRISHQKSLLDWIITPVFLIVFIFVLFIFEILFRFQRIFPALIGYQSLFSGLNQAIFFLLRVFVRVNFKIFGRFQDSNRPTLVISNHQSMFDIPFLSLALPELRLRFIAKKELATGIPGVSIALRNGEHAIIDRKDSSQALPEIERVANLSREKEFCLVLFPEGTRSRDGNLKEFKIGGIAKIIECLGEVQVVPVAIDGSWKLAQYSLWPIIFKQRVRVFITEAFLVKASDNIEACLQRSKEQIQKALSET